MRSRIAMHPNSLATSVIDVEKPPSSISSNCNSKDQDEYVLRSSALDPLDPLGWSWRKKHLVLATMCYMAFLADFLGGYGVPMVAPQMKEWHLSQFDAMRSISGTTFMQGIGSLVAVPLAQRYGMMPVMFWSTAFTLVFTMLCVSPGWIGFIAIRVLQGFFGTAAQVLGLTAIQEMFVFEEHARKIGIWGWAVLVGPYSGPFLCSFILRSLSWRQAFWLVCGPVFLGLVLIIVFFDETAWDREIPSNNPPRPSNPWKYQLQALTGVLGHRAKGRTTIAQGTRGIFDVFFQPHFLCLFCYHGLTYCWSVGINGTIPSFVIPKPYSFDTTAIGLFYLSPITAIILGEFFGHYFNDYLQDRSIKKSQGRQFVPEARLWALPVPTVLMAVGLVLLGQALGHQWHYMAIAAFWGLFVFSAMTSTVVITAYVLDCFPEHSVVTAALLNFARVLFGFLVPLFQKKWIDAIGGAQWSFLCQAVICLVAYVLVAVVQKFGGRWRERTGLSPDVIAMKSEARKGVRQV